MRNPTEVCEVCGEPTDDPREPYCEDCENLLYEEGHADTWYAVAHSLGILLDLIVAAAASDDSALLRRTKVVLRNLVESDEKWALFLKVAERSRYTNREKLLQLYGAPTNR